MRENALKFLLILSTNITVLPKVSILIPRAQMILLLMTLNCKDTMLIKRFKSLETGLIINKPTIRQLRLVIFSWSSEMISDGAMHINISDP